MILVKNKSTKASIIDYTIVFLLVLSGGGVAFVFQRNLMTALLLGVLFIGVISKINYVKKVYINRLLFTISILSLSLAVIYIFGAKDQGFDKYVFYFITFLAAGLSVFYFKLTKVPFLTVLEVILKIVLWHALINFILYPFLQGRLTTFVNDYNEYSYSTFMYLFNYMPGRGELGIFLRNQGVFWEAGVLQIFLNILFFISAFIFKRKGSFLILISLGILTTFSTTGLFILFMQVIILLWKKIKKNILLLPAVLIITIPLFILLQNNIEEKFVGDKSASAQIRMFDLFQQIIIVKENPITGVGLDPVIYAEIRNKSMYSLHMEFINFHSLEIGSTNSILFLLGAGGIPFAIYILMGLFKQNLIIQKKWLFLIIIVLSAMSSPVLFKPFFLLFVMSGKMKI